MVKFISGSSVDPNASRLIGIGLNNTDFDTFAKKGFIRISLKEIIHNEIPDIRAQDEIFLFHDETDQKMLDQLKERKWDMTNTIFRDVRGPNESA